MFSFQQLLLLFLLLLGVKWHSPCVNYIDGIDDWKWKFSIYKSFGVRCFVNTGLSQQQLPLVDNNCMPRLFEWFPISWVLVYEEEE